MPTDSHSKHSSHEGKHEGKHASHASHTEHEKHAAKASHQHEKQVEKHPSVAHVPPTTTPASRLGKEAPASLPSAAPAAPPTTLSSLDRHVANVQARLEELQKALTPSLASLSPDAKTALDRLGAEVNGLLHVHEG